MQQQQATTIPATFEPLTNCLFCDAPVENFIPGPRGGASQNATCPLCLAKYNLLVSRSLPTALFLEVLKSPQNTVALNEGAAQAFEREYGVREWLGYEGCFTRNEAPGAWPNKTRVVKVRSEPGDRHPNGTRGVVLGSMKAEGEPLCYFVEWEPTPRVAVAIIAKRLRRDR